MSNMSYCRFQNTLLDLQDVAEHLNEKLSGEEERAKNRLIDLCRDIIEEMDDEQGQEELITCVCGTEFLRSESDADNDDYCSKECEKEDEDTSEEDNRGMLKTVESSKSDK